MTSKTTRRKMKVLAWCDAVRTPGLWQCPDWHKLLRHFGLKE